MRACINNQQIRHHNKCVILELLYRQKRANKSTLARLAQISIPAVSNILQELESEKRVVNIDDESQTRGHSSGTWLIAPEGDWTLCLNVTPTSIECQVANACLSPKGEFEYLQIDAPTPQAHCPKSKNAGIATVNCGRTVPSTWRWQSTVRLIR